MRFSFCPICAAVSSTWIVLLVLLKLGHSIDPAFPAMLMGGSVVGIAYTLGLGKWQKFAFIPVGFLGMWGLLVSAWVLALLAAFVCAGIWAAQGSAGAQGGVDKLKDKMKNCC